jgi:hypothetical protein
LVKEQAMVDLKMKEAMKKNKKVDLLSHKIYGLADLEKHTYLHSEVTD